MASAELGYSNPFNTGSRPYLALQMTGINGADAHATGLIDSGADITQLPMGYASLMGYDAARLEPISVGTAGALTLVFRAKEPCVAYVVGLPAVTMALRPAFSASSPHVLWGRTDFMMTFGVMIDEKNQKFSLHW